MDHPTTPIKMYSIIVIRCLEREVGVGTHEHVLKQVVAFVLEAFFAEMEMHSAAKEAAGSDDNSTDDQVPI